LDEASVAKGFGLNVENGECEDLVKAGIIDPMMATRSARVLDERGQLISHPPRVRWRDA
jgi:hypothetical protein